MSAYQLLAMLASFVIIFFGNYLFYGVLSPGFFESHMGSASGVQKENVNMTFIALGCIIQAIALTTLYSKWANKKHSAIRGFSFGSLIGVLTGFGLGFVMYGTSNLLDLTAHLVDGLWYIFIYGIAGVSISLSMYKGKTSKAI